MPLIRALTALLLALLGTQIVAAPPRWSGPVAETAQSRIFAPLVLAGTAEDRALKAAGYVQEEWFLSGAGNIWREAPDGSTAVKQAGVPYTTRLVIVRPRDPRRFSGVVQMGFSHPSMANNNWSRIDALVLRSGMAYAALVIGGDAGTRQNSTAAWPVSTPLLLPWYDAKRYAAFRWPEDDGIRWDVIGQAASALRGGSRGGPLAGLKVRRLYVSGWSFLGSIQRSFIQYGFHERYRRPDGGPVIDGYLIGISAGSVGAGNIPLNSADKQRDRTKDLLRVIDSPVIELTSEMEAITNVSPQRPDSDAVKGGHRIYELGGVSHRDSGVNGQAAPAALQLAARRHPQVEDDPVCSVGYTDVPMRDVAQAVLVNLDRWVSTGQAPPPGARLAVTSDRKDYQRDRFGNPVGGVRAAQLDVPLVRYGMDKARCGGGEPRRKLLRLPVDPALLARTYPGGRAEYLARFDGALGLLVTQRWLLAPDAAFQRAAARRFAEQAFAR